MRKKQEQLRLPDTERVFRQNAVRAEIYDAYKTNRINGGLLSYCVRQVNLWDGLAIDPGLTNHIRAASNREYYGKSNPPAEKLVEPVLRDEEQKPEEQEIQTGEKSQSGSPPTQPTTPEPQAGSEPEIPQPSDQSGDNDSPPAEPALSLIHISEPTRPY